MGLYRAELTPDGKHKLVAAFHPGQTRAWNSTARFPLVLSGSQGGKTSFGPWWLNREVDRCGAGDYLAVTTSYPLFQLKMLPEIRRVFEIILKRGRYWPSLRTLELADEDGRFWAKQQSDPMWGRVILLSIGAPSALEASTANAAWLDEVGQDEWDVQHWEAILRRLGLRMGRALGTTTPYNMGWLKNEWYDRYAQGDPDYDVINFPSTLNPSFPQAEYDRAERTMPKWRFEMFYRGLFTRPAGLIYHMLEDDLWVQPFSIPHAWERIGCVDFGGANLAVIKLAEDPREEIWYCYEEQMMGGQSTPAYVSKVSDQDGSLHGGPAIKYVGGAWSEDQDRRDWAEAGIPVERPEVAEVEAGISRLIELIQTRRIRFFKTLSGLRHEFETYRRPLDSAGQPTEGIVDKQRFHRLDALRYGAVRIVGGGGGVLQSGPSPTEGYRG